MTISLSALSDDVICQALVNTEALITAVTTGELDDFYASMQLIDGRSQKEIFLEGVQETLRGLRAEVIARTVAKPQE